MIKKLIVIIAALAMAGCMPYLKQDFKSYTFNGKEVKLGMNADQVREIAGTPTHIEIPDPAPNIGTNTMFTNDVLLSKYSYAARFQPYRECWQYGNLEKGDREQLSITFTKGFITKIRKFTKK